MNILERLISLVEIVIHFLISTDFLVAFLSGMLVFIFSAMWVNHVTGVFKKPTLKMTVKQISFYRDSILLTKKEDGNYEASFSLAIKNNGNKPIKQGEGYWHVYIPNENNPLRVLGEDNHIRDTIKYTCYPGNFLDISDAQYIFPIKKEDLDKVLKTGIPYFFETDYGYFPDTIKIDQKTGAIFFKDMGSISVELPK